MAYDIFISYRRDGGKELARPLKSELERRGYRVFLDFDELKDGIFDRRIMDAIDSSPIFMVILSPHALDRCKNEDDWVRREIEYALEHDRHFIPVNPDQKFDGIPVELPEALKRGLGQHQFSEVMFGQLFMESVGKIVRERIEPLLSKLGRASADGANQVGALYHIETDMECRVFVFGKEIAVARPGVDTTIRLRKGRHRLEIISAEHPDDRLSMLHTVEDNEMEDILTVELLPVREKRLQAEAAERRRQEEEKRHQEEERRKAMEVAERKYCEEEERRRRAAEEEKYRKEAARKAAEEEKCRQEEWRKAAEAAERKRREEEERCRRAAEEEKRRKEEAARKAEAEVLAAKAYRASDAGNQAEAVKLWRKAAELGDADAQYSLGDCYESGRGVTQDYAEAVKWYRKAAEQGDAIAQYSLGDCYEFGRGVRQDYVEAVKWYRKVAEQGAAAAQNNLGKCYYCGQGVTQDYAEAVKWYRKAAEQGYARAQYNLGVCYYNGQGVTRDYAEAVRWCQRAADNGNENAKRELAEWKRKAAKSFTVGDYYNRNGKEGVVIEVDATGCHGKIVSMKQTECAWAVDKNFGLFFDQCNPSEIKVGADSRTDGMANMRVVRGVNGWRERYPAFAWCADRGDGWYLPALEELREFMFDDAVYDAVNRNLSQHGGDELLNGSGKLYWSSSEVINEKVSAWSVSAHNDRTASNYKNLRKYVRAVSAF